MITENVQLYVDKQNIIVMFTKDGSGVIESGLERMDRDEAGDEQENSEQYNIACDAIEALVLAHFIAGIDVRAPTYVLGIRTALDALQNQLF